MKLLAIETSGSACSAALLTPEGIRQRLLDAPRQHGALLLGLMQELLDEAGLTPAALDAIAFSRGPGSFTGVRIATAVAQGVALGAGLSTVPVSTLAAMAQGQFRRSGQRRLLAALDARMDEVYWGAFAVGSDGLVQPVGDEAVGHPEQVSLPAGEDWCGVGSGWAAHGQRLAARLAGRLGAVHPEAICEARDVATLGAAAQAAGRQVPPEAALPCYLRDRVTRSDQGAAPRHRPVHDADGGNAA